MPMPQAADVFRCASCLADIIGRPTIHVGVAFCCAGCAAGGPCLCSYDPEPFDDADAATLDPVVPDPLPVLAHDARRLAGVGG